MLESNPERLTQSTEQNERFVLVSSMPLDVVTASLGGFLVTGGGIPSGKPFEPLRKSRASRGISPATPNQKGTFAKSPQRKPVSPSTFNPI